MPKTISQKKAFLRRMEQMPVWKKLDRSQKEEVVRKLFETTKEEPTFPEKALHAIEGLVPVPQRMKIAKAFPGWIAPPSDAEVEEWNRTSGLTKIGREAGTALLAPLKNIPKMLPKKSPMPKGIPAPTIESEMMARAARQPPVTPPPPKLLGGAVASRESEAMAQAARQPHLAPQQPATPRLLGGPPSVSAEQAALGRAALQPQLAPQQPPTPKLLRGASSFEAPSGPIRAKNYGSAAAKAKYLTSSTGEKWIASFDQDLGHIVTRSDRGAKSLIPSAAEAIEGVPIKDIAPAKAKELLRKYNAKIGSLKSKGRHAEIPAIEDIRNTLKGIIFSNEKGAVTLPSFGKPPPPPAGTPLRKLDDFMQTPAKAKTTGGMTKTREQLEDQFAPIEVWERNARGVKTLAGVPVQSSPFKLARIFAGNPGKVQESYREIQQILKPFHGLRNRGTKKDFERYWLAKRVEERLERGIPTEKFTLADAKGGLRQLQDKYGVDGVRAFQDKVDELVAFADRRILQPMLDTGLLNRAQYDAIRVGNKNWAPFDVLHKLPDDPDVLAAGSQLFSLTKQDVVMAMKGFEEGGIRSLYDTLAGKMPQAISIVERNKVARAFFKLVEERPHLQGTIMPAGKGAPPRGMGSLSVFVDGSKQTFWAPKEIADAMKYMDSTTFGLFGRSVAEVTRMFRTGATSLYVPFVISNAFRDYKMAKLMNRHGFNIKDWMYGMKEGLKHSYGFDSPFMSEILEAGGGFTTWTQQMKKVSGSSAQFFRSTANVRMRKVLNPFELVSNFSQSVELAPRIGLARRTVRAGEGIRQAAWDARTGTIDFSKAGALMKTWNLFVPFLNARIQARMNVLTAFKENPVNAASVMFKWGFLPGLASYLYNTNYQSDLMDDVPQWIKDNYDYLIMGEVFDEKLQRNVPDLIIIPKGDIGQIAWNPMQNALDYIKANDKPSIAALATKFFSETVSPIEVAGQEGDVSFLRAASQLIPPAALGPIELATGKKFYFDTPTIPRRLQGLEKEEQYLESTPGVLKAVAPKVGLAPLEAQHLLQSLFAGTAREVLEPSSIPGLVGKRFRRQGGGVVENKAYKLVGEGTKGYKTARHRAVRGIKEGKGRKELLASLATWNKEAIQLVEKMKKLGLPTARFRKEITFSKADFKRIIESAREGQRKQAPLTKRLQRR